ncbi:MAG: ABC transporter transmembrane domain-containing protein [Pseudomonadota bacterium]
MKDIAENEDPDRLDPSIYRYIIRHTRNDQLVLLALTLISMPFVYLALDIPKLIVNQAIGGTGPFELFGQEMEQIPYLLALSCVFLALVVVNGALKYVNNVYRGALGERMLRRIRYTLYSHVLRFPLPHFRKISGNEVIPMVTAETEPLGGFIGDSIALPLFQGGLLITYLSFIFVQDFWLGIAAIALYPPQMYLIPKLQAKVNALAKERTLNVRKLADNVGETVSGIVDVHANNAGFYSRARVSQRLGIIFDIRYEIYKRKFFIKFLNNFLAQLTPFFFYSIGGYLVLKGQLSLGALVAVLAAYKDISPPWKELLKFYQIKEDIKVKYAQIIEQFTPDGLTDRDKVERRDTLPAEHFSALVANQMSYGDPDDETSILPSSFQTKLDQHVAIVSDDSQQATYLGQIICGLQTPASGRIQFDENDLNAITVSVLGKTTAYCDDSAFVFKGSVADNLMMGLKQAPVSEASEGSDSERTRFIKLAEQSGNSAESIDDNWIARTTSDGRDSQLEKLIGDTLQLVELDGDIEVLGLRQHITQQSHPELCSQIIDTRQRLKDMLTEDVFSSMVEPFNPGSFHTNITIGENIVFGSPVSSDFSLENLHGNESVKDLLAQHDLYESLVQIGYQASKILLEIFSDVPEDSDLFEQYSFIHADEFDEIRRLVAQVEETGQESMETSERQRFLGVAFQLDATRHRLGLIEDDLMERIVSVRQALSEKLGEDNTEVSFFSPEKYNDSVSVSDNILFGRIRYGMGNAREKINLAIRELLTEVGLGQTIIELGLNFDTGPAGSRLTSLQRQKLSLARSLLKQPQILVINRPLLSLDQTSQNRIMQRIRELRDNLGTFVVVDAEEDAARYDATLRISNQRVSIA